MMDLEKNCRRHRKCVSGETRNQKQNRKRYTENKDSSCGYNLVNFSTPKLSCLVQDSPFSSLHVVNREQEPSPQRIQPKAGQCITHFFTYPKVYTERGCVTFVL